MIPTPTENAPVFDLCSDPEKRFLVDLMQEEPGVLDHPIPELYALLRAVERMWGGTEAKRLTVPPGLMYYLVAYATYAHHVPEDVEEWRAGAVHDIYHILQGFIKSIALAIQDGSVVKHKDDSVYIDLFRIPQWFYDEVVQDAQALQPLWEGAGTHAAYGLGGGFP
jgi:hypothetical protein